MLQHCKSGSMALCSNNFEWSCSVQRAGWHSLLHPLQNITQSHILGFPLPPNKKKTVVGTSLYSQNPSLHDCQTMDSLFPQPTPSLLLLLLLSSNNSFIFK